MRVDIVCFDGVEELDALAPYEVLAIAQRTGLDVQPRLVALDAPCTLTTQHGVTLTVGTAWAPESADVLVVPGGGGDEGGEPGVAAEVAAGKLPAALAAAARPGLTMASVCTGTFLLAAAGITAGRPCTTHHAFVERLRAGQAEVVDARVVDDGDLVTAGGITSGIDLALWLLERELGAAGATVIERVLEHERRGTVWRRPAAA